MVKFLLFFIVSPSGGTIYIPTVEISADKRESLAERMRQLDFGEGTLFVFTCFIHFYRCLFFFYVENEDKEDDLLDLMDSAI